MLLIATKNLFPSCGSEQGHCTYTLNSGDVWYTKKTCPEEKHQHV